MRISIISFAGANELTPKKDVLDFLRKNPMAEIGFGVSEQKSGTADSERFQHIMGVQRIVGSHYEPGKIGTVGLHVNGIGTDGTKGWPHRVMNCDIPENLAKMIDFPRTSLQINFSNYDISRKEAGKFATCRGCESFRHCRLRLPYNTKTANVIEHAHLFNHARPCSFVKADILFDASFGEGKLANKYEAPKFHGVRHIYAGGLGPENIYEELGKIAEVQKDLGVVVGIDMEGKVRTDDGKTLDLNKADAVYKIVMDWLKDNGR